MRPSVDVTIAASTCPSRSAWKDKPKSIFAIESRGTVKP